MYITRDYLKVGSWQAIIDMINDKYNFQLSPGITKLKTMTRLGPKRTQIEISPNRSRDAANLLPEITETVFTYDRLNCTEFFRNTVAVNVSGLKLPISTFDILRQIGEHNEIVFEPDDFVHQTFDHYSGVTENDFVIQADEQSLRFVGNLKVRLVNTTKVDISSFTGKVAEFPEVMWRPQLDKIRGDYYLSRYDFTAYRDSLKDIPVGLYNIPKQLLGPIYKTTRTMFSVSNTPVQLNLVHTVLNGVGHLKVLYNGAPIPLWTRRTDFRKVLVVELSEELSTGIRGFLRLHYD